MSLNALGLQPLKNKLIAELLLLNQVMEKPKDSVIWLFAQKIVNVKLKLKLATLEQDFVKLHLVQLQP
jgi:hypothetical protein